MTENADIRIQFHEEPRSNAKIKVIGVGGGGGNAVNRMIDAGVEGVDFLVANTDLQALRMPRAGEDPARGEADQRAGRRLQPRDRPRRRRWRIPTSIIEVLEGADMVFVTAGLGGGTGTGAAPIIASLASELGALTVAVVTKPFAFEGGGACSRPSSGLAELARRGRHGDHHPQRTPAGRRAQDQVSSRRSASPTTSCARRCRASATSSPFPASSTATSPT